MVIVSIIIEIIVDVERVWWRRPSICLIFFLLFFLYLAFLFFSVLLLLTEASRGIRGIIKINDSNPICPPNLASIMIIIDIVGLWFTKASLTRQHTHINALTFKRTFNAPVRKISTHHSSRYERVEMSQWAHRKPSNNIEIFTFIDSIDDSNSNAISKWHKSRNAERTDCCIGLLIC